jgi:hypothetical protein
LGVDITVLDRLSLPAKVALVTGGGASRAR